MEFFGPSPETPDQGLEEMLSAVGTQAGLFVERALAEEQLRQASVNLQRSNTDLQQFAYVASHDLFEPLRMVTSYLQLLSHHQKHKLDAEAKEFIALAVDGARRMEALIHDLLEYSRVDTRGRSFQPTESEEAFKAAVSNLKVLVEESGADIQHTPLPRVCADSVQLTQLFQNLLGNAIKFRGPEPPRVEVTAERNNNEWRFGIKDNGIGIDAKFFERIFVLFQRLHTRQEYAGTGMGLAICKKIVERHGGRIWVESKPREGSSFFFTLPVLNDDIAAPDGR
jgi:light-regulated signal transduction histidine kinase (bacteriophytochrome)